MGKAADYKARMNQAIHRVRPFEKLSPYTLRIRFDNDLEWTSDFLPLLVGETLVCLLIWLREGSIRLGGELWTHSVKRHRLQFMSVLNIL